jgi:hypothetical protein
MADVEPKAPSRRRTHKADEAPSRDSDSRHVESAADRGPEPEEPGTSDDRDARERSAGLRASAMTSGGLPVPGRARQPADHRQQSTNLADILERVLDKGIVIAGDIRVNLLDIELLTIQIRLLIASVDKAREIGIDWWEHDPTLSSGQRDLPEENRRLRERVGELEAGHTARRSGEDKSPREPIKTRDRKPGSDG